MNEICRGNKATLLAAAIVGGSGVLLEKARYVILKEEIIMKKSLVLAMAMALGVTASAYAANPFSDVPAGHWAYDAVSKLAAEGVIDGFPNGTFGGDKLMTRYEMAQIVAKAMAKGADVDKLAAEFSDELDSLGVRVAKLEDKSDNVKITGQVRYRYVDSDKDGYKNDLRSRLWINGQINDEWSATGMIENVQNFGNDNGDETTKFQRAYVNGKIGGMDLTAGRYSALFADGNVYDARVDGAELTYGDKVQLKGFVGKATDAKVLNSKKEEVDGSYGNYAGGELKFAMGDNAALKGGYVNFKDMNQVSGEAKSGQDDAIWYAGADFAFGDFGVNGMYLKGDANSKSDKAKTGDDGFVVGVSYKGAKASEVGSYGLFANYYNQGGQTYVAHTTDANTFNGDGFKGYGVGANYTFAKNMVGKVAYYDTENKLNSKDDDKIIWADMTFSF